MTKIEWADKTWNPVTGCTPISEGCENCYAARMAKRLAGRAGYPQDEPFRVTCHPDRLEQPLKWTKPSRIFVCSMGDLFHEDIPNSFIEEVFAIMSVTPQHTFMVLTKRPERMLNWLSYDMRSGMVAGAAQQMGYKWLLPNVSMDKFWPLPNVWLGVTAENQEQANARLPILCKIPATVKFASAEPLLGTLDLSLWMVSGYEEPPFNDAINWVICGTETGFKRRPAKREDILHLKNQCVSAGVPFFLKQMDVNGKIVKMPELDGQIWNQFPEVDKL